MKFSSSQRDGQTAVEFVLMIAVAVGLFLVLNRQFLQPAFQRALKAWDAQLGDAFKTRLKQRWF